VPLADRSMGTVVPVDNGYRRETASVNEAPGQRHQSHASDESVVGPQDFTPMGYADLKSVAAVQGDMDPGDE
jgi:hypothetical protein